jgi:SAM-dependent methyltransferase
MTGHTTRFIQDFLLEHPIKGKVLEVGSRYVNGEIRNVFEENGLEYTGLDMVAGRCVDIVCNAHDIKKNLKRASFDLVVCVDTLEHDDKFWLSVENMRWVLKRGGWLVIKAPSLHCNIHDWPSDYYRFLEPVFKEIFFEGFKDVFTQTLVGSGATDMPDSIVGYGRKP